MERSFGKGSGGGMAADPNGPKPKLNSVTEINAQKLREMDFVMGSKRSKAPARF
jgi:hypothetical protein